MNQNQTREGYTYTRGWGAPAAGVIFGVFFALGGAWLVLSSLFAEVGSKAAATIVLIAGSCLVGGILLALAVVALVRGGGDRPPAPTMSSQASYEVLPATRQPALIPSRPGLRPEDAKMALRFSSGRTAEVPAGAMLWFLSRSGPADMVRGTNGWRWANEAYTVGRAWLIDQQTLRNDNVWLDREAAMTHLGLWRDHVMS